MVDLSFFWELLKSTCALWLGAYLLTRSASKSRTQMTAAALMVWSLAPFGAAMMLVSSDAELTLWTRFLVATYPIMVGLLFGVALSLFAETVMPARTQLLRHIYHAVIVLGIVIGLFAGGTNLMFDYGSVQPSVDRSVYNLFARLGTLEPLYAAYRTTVPLAVVGLFCITYWTVWRRKDVQRRGLFYLMLAALVWLAGLGLKTVLYQSDVLASTAIGEGFVFYHLSDPVFVLAIGLMGYGVVQHNAIVQGRIVRRDFGLSAAGLLVIVLAFGLLPLALNRYLYGTDQPAIYFFALFACWVAVLTHITAGRIRRRADVLFGGDAESRLRDEVAETMQASIEGKPLAETLDALEQFRPKLLIREHVNKQLLRALDSAEGNVYLATSPLQQLTIVQSQLPEQPTERQQAAAIHTLLDQALTHLEAEATPSNRQQELLQVIHLRLRDGLDRSDITRRLHLHPRKYDRLLSDGIVQLADAILELDQTKSRA